MEVLQHTYELQHRPEAVCKFLEIKQQEINPVKDLQTNLYYSEFDGERTYFVTVAGPAAFVRWIDHLLNQLKLVLACNSMSFSKEMSHA